MIQIFKNPTQLFWSFLWLLLPCSSNALHCKYSPIVNLDDNGAVTLPADFLILDVNTGCCPTGNSYDIQTFASSSFQPNATFTCAELGQQVVTIRLTDCTGTQSYCQTNLIIQDNSFICEFGCGNCCLPAVKAKPLTVALSENNSLLLHAAWFDDGSSSDCAPGDVNISFSPDIADTLRALTCNELGPTTIQIWATDAAGNQAFAEIFVITQLFNSDCIGTGDCLPSPIVVIGLVVEVATDGIVCLNAQDFNIASHASACNSATSISLAFSEDPNDVQVCFTCDEIGIQAIPIYVLDNLGGVNFVETIVIVEDVMETCDSPSNLIPPNDNICNAIAIEHIINNNCSSYYFNIGATAQTNEVAPPTGTCATPNTWCDSAIPEKTVWFKFVAQDSQNITISATGIDTQLALWEADSCDSLANGNGVLIAANDDSPILPGGGSQITAYCLAGGKTYFLQMDGYENDEGFFEISVSTEASSCINTATNNTTANIGFSIYPNPASHLVNINIPNIEAVKNGKIILTDISGEALLEWPFEQRYPASVLNIEGINSGVYFMQLLSNGAISTPQKLVILRRY